MKKQALIQKSIQKKQKLSTGVTKLSSSGVKLSPHIKKKKNKINNLKKEKEKNAFPCSKAGNGAAPKTTRISPNLFRGGVKKTKSANVGVASYFVDYARQKIEGIFKNTAEKNEKRG